MILCDIGNSTFDFLINNKRIKYSVDTKISKLPNLNEQLYFISVNQKATKKLLKKYPKAIDISNLYNFKTKYQGLGIDRQIAMIGMKNNIIVDVGSAITVDIVANNQHKGGFILSGIKNLNLLYPKISSKLKFDFIDNLDLNKIPQNTNEAISYAILKSIILPIKDMQDKYNLPIIFTGEDSKIIKKYFKNSKYKKNLIFKNMKKIIKKGKI
jgi:type III pantothenate kinase